MMRNRTKTRLMGIAFAAIAFTGTGAALAQDYGYDDDGLRAYADDSDAAINDRVRFSLDRALGDRAEDISVRTVDGIVYLRGSVPSEAERRIAHDAVYEVDGVEGLRIDNLYAGTYYDYRY